MTIIKYYLKNGSSGHSFNIAIDSRQYEQTIANITAAFVSALLISFFGCKTFLEDVSFCGQQCLIIDHQYLHTDKHILLIPKGETRRENVLGG